MFTGQQITLIIWISVFVNANATLYRAGTVIKGMSGVGEESSYLCVARDGKIMAEGTGLSNYIHFEADPLDGSTLVTTRGRGNLG